MHKKESKPNSIKSFRPIVVGSKSKPVLFISVFKKYFTIPLLLILFTVSLYSCNKANEGQAQDDNNQEIVANETVAPPLPTLRLGFIKEERRPFPVFTDEVQERLCSILSDDPSIRGTVYIEDSQGKILFDCNSTEYYVPASTLKIYTSAMALYFLGEDYRFKTLFYLDEENNLYVYGTGDPFLISEEFPLITAQLKEKGLTQVHNIYTDDSFFNRNIDIPGRDYNERSYDAAVNALCANFNTVYVHRNSMGIITSAEDQTPLTDFAVEIARQKITRNGNNRINITYNPENAPLYVGHLLKSFLIKEDIMVSGEVSLKTVPPDLSIFLEYASSKDLKEVIRGLLEYSNNLIANNLLLTVGATLYDSPATLEKGVNALKRFLEEAIGIENAIINEGSGLCHENRITAREMVMVLDFLAGYRDLFLNKDGFLSKSGGLEISASEAGYIQSPSLGTLEFVIMINDVNTPEPTYQRLYPYKEQIMEILQQELF